MLCDAERQDLSMVLDTRATVGILVPDLCLASFDGDSGSPWASQYVKRVFFFSGLLAWVGRCRKEALSS